MPNQDQRRIVIVGAAGRDFHNFNVVYRHDPSTYVVAFTAAQLAALERSIAATPVDTVISGTPIDLAALVHIPQRIVRARYEFADSGDPTLGSVIDAAIERLIA